MVSYETVNIKRLVVGAIIGFCSLFTASSSSLFAQTCPESMTLRQESCPGGSSVSCTTGGSSTSGTLTWQELDRDILNTISLCNGPGLFTWPSSLSAGYLHSDGSGVLTVTSGVFPSTTTSTTSQWFSAYDSSAGTFTKTQPAFSDVSGTNTAAKGGTGLNTSASTGISRIASGTWSISELSGDTTTSGSNTTTTKQIHLTQSTIIFSQSPYSILSSDSTISCNAVSGAITINLPAATGTGRVIRIKKIDSSANGCTLTRASSDTIDGATTVALTSQYASTTVEDSGSGLWIRTHVSQLGGDVSGATSATTVTKINGVALSGLATGILKNTTTTGVPSIAGATDFGSGTPSSSVFLRGDLTWSSPTASVTGGWDVANKNTSDQNVTAGSLTDVTGLTYTIPSTGTYEFESLLIMTAGSSSGNEAGLGYTASGSITAIIVGHGGAAQTVVDGAISVTTSGSQAGGTYCTSAALTCVVHMFGTLTASASGGTFSVKMDRLGGSGTSVAKSGSTFKVRKIN